MSNTTKNLGRRAGERFDGDLRRVLMDAAISAHGDSGFDQLSLRAVARSIDVSHAAPAHYFGDKAGLLTAIATEGFELLTRRLADVAILEGEPLTVLQAMARVYADFAVEQPAHFDAMFRRELLRADDQFEGAGGGAYDAFEALIRSFQDAGWHTKANTTELTTATWALIHGLCMLQLGGGLERKHPNSAGADLVRIAANLLTP